MLNTIQGGISKDHRGEIRFVNDFDMEAVKRFYIIKNADTDLVRGWRAHCIEQRWFYVLSGAFIVDLVQIDDWNAPSQNLPVERLRLEAESMRVLHVPVGYGTAFQALQSDSELLVYADHGIDNASFDDHTYPIDYFLNRKTT
ncbi:WxcM-like domain-containing protein [Sphingobacterium thalpophilum]|uniref:WxcM-like domain-containing protein n=1 Tax=Sphingobacterium thalpophilum TaxID=259 RepID=UPI0024A6846A|nr:WxcM-like domain-containing protein [Sphingobacterium thalpophilum]